MLAQWLGFWTTFKSGVVKIGGLTIIFGILDFLLKWNILSSVFSKKSTPIMQLWQEILREISASPVVIFLLGILALFLWLFWNKLKIVAGEFSDDFKHGLDKWEFGGEGWKIEKDKMGMFLSVSHSDDGGITKKGFTWSDYEFSFENAIVKHNVGWIIRAESRNKYLMIQLHLEDESNPRLRLHLRHPGYPWVITEDKRINLSKPIKYLDWIKVGIVVNGSNVDVYLNGEHSEHYFLSDPFRFKFEKEDNEVILNYAVGRVGFRCGGPNEHAHFRNVKVRPL